MTPLRFVLMLLLAAVNLPTAVLAQNPDEAGRPFITNFAPSEYDAELQNWAVVEDDRGVIYVANSTGLLEYDGVAWRLILLPNRGNVRSLGRDDEGRIWVGGTGDLGYLAPDSVGQTSFVSLKEELPESERDFAEVWNLFAVDGRVLFLTVGKVFRWDGSGMQVIPAITSFHNAFVVGGVFYVRQWELGLTRLDDLATSMGTNLLPGGERFAGTRIYSMLPFDADQILIGTREEGFFLYDGATFQPFATDADDLIAEGGLYLPGAVLSDGRFAFGTLTNGLGVIDRSGRLVLHLGQDSGLRSDNVLFPYLTRSGTLWLALGDGLARVEIGSAFTRFDESTGITEQLSSAVRQEGRLYVSMNRGAVRYDPSTRSFQTLSGPVTQTFKLISSEGEILVAGANEGVYRVDGDRVVPVRASVAGDYITGDLFEWQRHPGTIVVGLSGGVGVLRRVGKAWVDEGRIPGVELDVWLFAEDAEGRIWVGTHAGQVARISLPGPDGLGRVPLDQAEVLLLGGEQGVPPGIVYPYRVGGTVLFTGQGERVFQFDEGAGGFVEDHTFDAARSGHPLAIFSLREDAAGNVWIASTYGAPVVARPRADGGYTIEKGVLQRLRPDRIIDVFPEADGIVWFLGDELVRYDPSLDPGVGDVATPFIRRVAVADGPPLYGGFGEAVRVEVPFGTGAIQISYAAPSAIGSVRFRTRLDGLDEDWTAWHADNERSFTNLSPGDYTFHVESDGGGTATYELTILPPWYRTWWAYFLWVGLLGGLIYTTSRVQRHRLITKERERSALLEARLRADAADANAKALQADNDRKQNVELLSRIGQTITSTLSVSEIIDTVYEHVNALMDAEIFGVGIYNQADQRIDYPATKEKGVTLAPYVNRLDDANRLGVWCFTHGKEVVIGDFAKEFSRFLGTYEPPISGEYSESVLYLPLVHQDRPIGVITTQSFKKNAYTEYHVNLLRNLATYTAIALDNASAYRTLEKTVSQLQSTQKQLVEQEKLASLGSLTAGIAHEIKNPLNFVNNFAEVNAELAEEAREALNSGDLASLGQLLTDLENNAAQISKHGKRADSIVRSMMQHARGGASERETIVVNDFLEEYAGLAWHGLRARDESFKADLVRDLDPAAGSLSALPQELGRVLLNLLSNAFQAVQEKKRAVAETPDGSSFAPRVTISSRRTGDGLEISVADNGPGIPPAIREKIFEPFFTTKPTGEGTGLGLSLSYDIVTKGHGGMLSVDEAPGGGARFVVTVPV